jgi:hypothetical protein
MSYPHSGCGSQVYLCLGGRWFEMRHLLLLHVFQARDSPSGYVRNVTIRSMQQKVTEVNNFTTEIIPATNSILL